MAVTDIRGRLCRRVFQHSNGVVAPAGFTAVDGMHQNCEHRCGSTARISGHGRASGSGGAWCDRCREDLGPMLRRLTRLSGSPVGTGKTVSIADKTTIMSASLREDPGTVTITSDDRRHHRQSDRAMSVPVAIKAATAPLPMHR